MDERDARRPVRQAVRDSGLLLDGRPVLVMLSGGQDSVCLLDVAVALCEPGDVSALHVNYGLREQADADERLCRELCGRLGLKLHVVRAGTWPRLGEEVGATCGPGGDVGGVSPAAARGASPSADGGPSGNLHAWARDVRYAAAERAAEEGDALIATGHTASDQVETILYRLAASPGRRALLGMAAAEGRLIRPLLAIRREQTAAYCRAAGLAWATDASNDDQKYARARVRNGLLEAVRAVHPGAESNVLRTAMLLREETALMDGLVERELDGRAEISLARLERLPRALARLIVIRLAEDAAGTYVPQAGDRVEEILRLARRGGAAELHVGGRAGALIDHGSLRMVKLPPRADRPAAAQGLDS